MKSSEGRRRSGLGAARRAWTGALERLEGRTLLNASIDVAADGSLLYRSGPSPLAEVKISRVGEVYTFAANIAIDVGGNAPGLAVTGSGTPTVTVTGPASLRIEVAAVAQRVQIESTGVAADVAFQAHQQFLTLGGAGGVQALEGPITVSTDPGASDSRLIVDDAAGAYDAVHSPEYVLTADAIGANDPDVQARFAGITYSGVPHVTLLGTRQSSAASPLFLVYDTPDDADLSISADGFVGGAESTAPHVAVLGTSADPSSDLLIGSNVRPVISLASNSSQVTYLDRYQGPGAWIRVEGVRGEGYGLGADLVVLAGETGRVDVSIGNFWNPTRFQGDANWFMGYDPVTGPDNAYAALRDANGPAASGIYFRPGSLHSLNVDARGNRGASMMVDFRNGNPVPYGAPATGATNLPLQSLTYVGASATNQGSPYALSFVGDDASPYSYEVHTAVPLYRGLIALSEAPSPAQPRRVAYQLDSGAPLFDDTLAVGSYSFVYEIMDGTLASDYRLRRAPDGSIVSSAVPSDLALTAGGAAIDGRASLRIAERNPDAFLAETRINDKARAAVLRRWSIAPVSTTIDYASPAAVPGLLGLSVVDDSPSTFASNDVARLDALPPGVGVNVLQQYGDDRAIVSADGVAPASLVWLDGGPGTNTLEIDADQQVLRIDDLGDARFAVVRVVAGLGEVLFLYHQYGTPTIVDAPTSPQIAAVDGVALLAAADANETTRRKAGRS
ncbi:hypothetical protein [Paludisphaera soli]|uniref:hypothetical protein n=1 Tax=Paludisphaera soli TaxID=2712865 RepID=UPI0013EC1F14|nr:hypothetical protein [Paludisphaera soli]